ncbi:MAG: cytochrome c oxidase subunit 3 family protein [Pseudomonadota bacterium]
MSPDIEAPSSRPRSPEPRRLPGVEGVWAFVFADMTMFAVMFGSFMWDRHRNPLAFEESRHLLNATFGGINTLILLTSSLFVVLAIEALKAERALRARWLFALALACGFAFMLAKAFEYGEKFQAGISMLSNDFFMYYFILTGIHLGHVIVGNVVLAVMSIKSASATNQASSLANYEAGATYWHMVDLLWILLFPILYLLR